MTLLLSFSERFKKEWSNTFFQAISASGKSELR